MNKLITFGCSNTYGQGLPDCYDPEIPWRQGPNPSKYAWPQLLADSLDWQLVNLGMPGVSNKYIERVVLNQEYKENDVVVILWTYSARSHLYFDDGTSLRLLPSDLEYSPYTKNYSCYFDQKITKFYYKRMHSDFDSWLDFFTRLNNVRDYLDWKGVKNYHFSCEDHRESYFNKSPDWNRTKLHWTPFDLSLQPALDKIHPGEQSHINLANTMFNIINTYIINEGI